MSEERKRVSKDAFYIVVSCQFESASDSRRGVARRRKASEANTRMSALIRALAALALLACASAGEEYESGAPVTLYANKVSCSAALTAAAGCRGPCSVIFFRRSQCDSAASVPLLPDAARSRAGRPIRQPA